MSGRARETLGLSEDEEQDMQGQVVAPAAGGGWGQSPQDQCRPSHWGHWFHKFLTWKLLGNPLTSHSAE